MKDIVPVVVGANKSVVVKFPSLVIDWVVVLFTPAIVVEIVDVSSKYK